MSSLQVFLGIPAGLPAADDHRQSNARPCGPASVGLFRKMREY
jgi:hypothetical protein